MTLPVCFDLIILIPVLDDSESLALLLHQIDTLPELKAFQLGVLVVNDGGSEIRLRNKYSIINDIQILNLVRNFGHQKAIAFGLSYLSENFEVANVIVMDGDGEDKASDIVRLIRLQIENSQHIVFASRAERSESMTFRFFYFCYKIIFLALTGERLSFGNFCIIPGQYINKIVYISDIMSHFAAGILKARLPITTIPVSRGTRLKGNSKMIFTSLIIHGFNSFAVYFETLSVRLLLFSLFVGLLALIALGLVFSIKYLTDLAIAGWATSTSLGLAIVAMQGITLASIVAMLHLASRIYLPLPPIMLYRNFIAKVERLGVTNDE